MYFEIELLFGFDFKCAISEKLWWPPGLRQPSFIVVSQEYPFNQQFLKVSFIIRLQLRIFFFMGSYVNK